MTSARRTYAHIHVLIDPPRDGLFGVLRPEQVDKVFDKFYRVDASDTGIEGTGLGMTIVKHIVEAHNGRIYLESELGKGTIVTFTVPVESRSK